MKIKMRTQMSGPAVNAAAGAVIDMEKAAAYDLIEKGFAEQVEEAVVGPHETAEAPANRRRRRS